MYPTAYFREYPLYSVIPDFGDKGQPVPLSVRYNEGLLYFLMTRECPCGFCDSRRNIIFEITSTNNIVIVVDIL
jgi:hypothetical protein